MYYYSKFPAVSKFGLSLVMLNPSTFNRVYIVKKGGILVRSRYKDGPVVAGAAIVIHYYRRSIKSSERKVSTTITAIIHQACGASQDTM